MIVDLHCHSTASDGSLSPGELIQRAADQDVELLSLTDHDTIAGYQGLDVPAGLRLVGGIELSCVWSGVTVHIVGLGIDLDSEVMQAVEQRQGEARERRAQVIAERLERRGFVGVYDHARAGAGSRPLGRPDFARALVELGHVASESEAFDRYLGAGKIGDVKAMWPELATVLEWILLSGGVPVLAHPLYYRMTATKLRALIAAFVEAGGVAMEVCSGKPSADDLRYSRRLCEQFGLEASIGSDFHQPLAWNELGRDSAVAHDLPGVWERWL